MSKSYSSRRPLSLAMPFAVGDRVQSHPATDAWMAGDRFGSVEKVGHRYVHVRMDRSGRLRRFTVDNIIPVANARQTR